MPTSAEATVFRDSRGALRTEQIVPGAGFVNVEILDPVGYVYVLDPVRQIAHRVTVRLHPQAILPAFHNEFTQSLGTKVISGVPLDGQRTTARDGSVNEVWTDPKNSVSVIRTSSSSNGTSTKTTEDYRNTEPDPRLFQIPDGYKIVDEPTGKLTIEISEALTLCSALK